MKFHRVLLFTSIQMDITPVGDDLHVLLTCGGENRLGCTAFSTPVTDTDPVECETSVITDVDNPEDLFCPYIAESLCKKTGQRVLCTGGIFVENPDQRENRTYICDFRRGMLNVRLNTHIQHLLPDHSIGSILSLLSDFEWIT